VRARGLQGRGLRIEDVWRDQHWFEQDLLKNFTISLPFLYRKMKFDECTSGVEITSDYLT
jgi:hypothetical protein